MPLLDRVSPKTRLKTGWLLPAAVASAISVFAPDTATAVSRPDQLRYGVLILGGVAIGILWQWFSPRDLAYRLALPAGAMVLAGLLFLVRSPAR